MPTLTGDAAITRFKENEERIDKFVNGSSTESYVSSTGALVETIAKFLARKDGEINVGATAILAQNVAVRDATAAFRDQAENFKDDAEAANVQVQAAFAALAAMLFPSSVVGQANKYLAVKADESGYELRPLTTDLTAFYGFKLNGATLQVDTGVGNYTETDYFESTFAPAGLTFSINAAGELIVTF